MFATRSEKRLEAAKNKAADSLERLSQTLSWLDADPAAEDRWGRLDAVAKRFEVAFEYVWKALKAALEHQGEIVHGPREAITSAAHYEWIDDLDAWSEFLQARNAGVHDYFALSEEEYAEIARRFLHEATSTLERLP